MEPIDDPQEKSSNANKPENEAKSVSSLPQFGQNISIFAKESPRKQEPSSIELDSSRIPADTESTEKKYTPSLENITPVKNEDPTSSNRPDVSVNPHTLFNPRLSKFMEGQQQSQPLKTLDSNKLFEQIFEGRYDLTDESIDITPSQSRSRSPPKSVKKSAMSTNENETFRPVSRSISAIFLWCYLIAFHEQTASAKKMTNQEFENFYEKTVLSFQEKKEKWLRSQLEAKLQNELESYTGKPMIRDLPNPGLVNLPFMERVAYYSEQKEKHLSQSRKEHAERQEEANKELTFQPNIHRRRSTQKFERSFSGTEMSHFGESSVTKRRHSRGIVLNTDDAECKFRPKLSEVTQKLSEKKISETHPEVVERFKILNEKHAKDLERLRKDLAPSFAPALNPKSLELVKNREQRKRSISASRAENKENKEAVAIASSENTAKRRRRKKKDRNLQVVEEDKKTQDVDLNMLEKLYKLKESFSKADDMQKNIDEPPISSRLSNQEAIDLLKETASILKGNGDELLAAVKKPRKSRKPSQQELLVSGNKRTNSSDEEGETAELRNRIEKMQTNLAMFQDSFKQAMKEQQKVADTYTMYLENQIEVSEQSNSISQRESIVTRPSVYEKLRKDSQFTDISQILALESKPEPADEQVREIIQKDELLRRVWEAIEPEKNKSKKKGERRQRKTIHVQGTSQDDVTKPKKSRKSTFGGIEYNEAKWKKPSEEVEDEEIGRIVAQIEMLKEKLARAERRKSRAGKKDFDTRRTSLQDQGQFSARGVEELELTVKSSRRESSKPKEQKESHRGTYKGASRMSLREESVSKIKNPRRSVEGKLVTGIRKKSVAQVEGESKRDSYRGQDELVNKNADDSPERKREVSVEIEGDQMKEMNYVTHENVGNTKKKVKGSQARMSLRGDSDLRQKGSARRSVVGNLVKSVNKSKGREEVRNESPDEKNEAPESSPEQLRNQGKTLNEDVQENIKQNKKKSQATKSRMSLRGDSDLRQKEPARRSVIGTLVKSAKKSIEREDARSETPDDKNELPESSPEHLRNEDVQENNLKKKKKPQGVKSRMSLRGDSDLLEKGPARRSVVGNLVKSVNKSKGREEVRNESPDEKIEAPESSPEHDRDQGKRGNEDVQENDQKIKKKTQRVKRMSLREDSGLPEKGSARRSVIGSLVKSTKKSKEQEVHNESPLDRSESPEREPPESKAHSNDTTIADRNEDNSGKVPSNASKNRKEEILNSKPNKIASRHSTFQAQSENEAKRIRRKSALDEVYHQVEAETRKNQVQNKDSVESLPESEEEYDEQIHSEHKKVARRPTGMGETFEKQRAAQQSRRKASGDDESLDNSNVRSSLSPDDKQRLMSLEKKYGKNIEDVIDENDEISMRAEKSRAKQSNKKYNIKQKGSKRPISKIKRVKNQQGEEQHARLEGGEEESLLEPEESREIEENEESQEYMEEHRNDERRLSNAQRESRKASVNESEDSQNMTFEFTGREGATSRRTSGAQDLDEAMQNERDTSESLERPVGKKTLKYKGRGSMQQNDFKSSELKPRRLSDGGKGQPETLKLLRPLNVRNENLKGQSPADSIDESREEVNQNKASRDRSLEQELSSDSSLRPKGKTRIPQGRGGKQQKGRSKRNTSDSPDVESEGEEEEIDEREDSLAFTATLQDDSRESERVRVPRHRQNIHVERVSEVSWSPDEKRRPSEPHDRFKSRFELMMILLKYLPKNLILDQDRLYTLYNKDKSAEGSKSLPRKSAVSFALPKKVDKKRSKSFFQK